MRRLSRPGKRAWSQRQPTGATPIVHRTGDSVHSMHHQRVETRTRIIAEVTPTRDIGHSILPPRTGRGLRVTTRAGTNTDPTTLAEIKAGAMTTATTTAGRRTSLMRHRARARIRREKPVRASRHGGKARLPKRTNGAVDRIGWISQVNYAGPLTPRISRWITAAPPLFLQGGFRLAFYWGSRQHG